MIEVNITEKIKKIIGVVMIMIGLSVFFISHSQGLVGQNVYSNLGCAVDPRPNFCTIANNQMTAVFIGMIFAFFTALFGASLVVPPTLKD